MVVGLIPVVMIGARIVARFAASKAGREAAKKFTKEFGGRVVEKGKNLKSVQKAPTGSQATRQMKTKLKSDTINPSKSGMRPGAKPPAKKTPDPRGSTTQKLLLAGATTGLASGVDVGKPSKGLAQSKPPQSEAEAKGKTKGVGTTKTERRASPGGSGKGADAPIKKFNVGVSRGGVPFKEAFAHFRKKGAKTFTWNGTKYTTKLKSAEKKK